MLSLPLQVLCGMNKVSVLVTGILDPPIQFSLEQLTDAVAVRSNDHGPPHRASFNEFSLSDHFVVPGGKVLVLRG